MTIAHKIWSGEIKVFTVLTALHWQSEFTQSTRRIIECQDITDAKRGVKEASGFAKPGPSGTVTTVTGQLLSELHSRLVPRQAMQSRAVVYQESFQMFDLCFCSCNLRHFFVIPCAKGLCEIFESRSCWRD